VSYAGTEGAGHKPFGPLSGFDLGNGIEVRKTFDQDYRLTALTADGVMDLSYIHYLNGMIREITDNLDPARSQYFTYDNLGRLKTANGVYGRMAWTYDNVGNRLTETRNGITESYTYKTGTNIIESVDGALDKTFTHDDDGNIHTALIQKTSASPSVTADYMYTSDGLRLRKTAGGTVVLYHYDFAGNLIGESGIGGENFKAYVYFAGTRVATVAADGSVCYYHNNHLETPVSMTDGSGNVVWKADYKPFGKAEVSSASTVVNDFRFPGQYYDSETGLHYNWNRYYDPSIGRYLTADPIGLLGGVNLYSYVEGNPINSIDPHGLYRDIGGGFGLTLAVANASISYHTETCCDDQGNKHIRTIESICIGLEFGLGLESSHSANASVSDDKAPKKCPKMYDNTGWYSDGSGVWGALLLGRSYSNSDGAGWIFGFGGGWNVYSGCRNNIKNDVIYGKCCNK